MTIPSFQLNEDEHVLLVLHRHWFVIVRELTAVLVLIFFGAIAFTLRETFYPIFDESLLTPLSTFLFAVYALVLLEFVFVLWINYRLDVWIVTTRRVIDVEQRGLFNREISEFLIARVQDVTTEVPTVIATLLNFGTMTIHTAGGKSFIVYDVPRLEDAKKIILECSQQARKEEINTTLPSI